MVTSVLASCSAEDTQGGSGRGGANNGGSGTTTASGGNSGDATGGRGGGGAGGNSGGSAGTGVGGGGGATGGATGGSAGGSGSGGTGGTTGSGGSGGSAGNSASGGSGGAAGNGMAGRGGSAGSAGTSGVSDAGRSDGSAGSGGTTTPDGGSCAPGEGGTAKFSFFLTSMVGIRRLSGSQNGFGGDLRFGKPTGLEGADEICRQLAETGYPGAGCKTWRAFLSITKGPLGTPVNAGDRVGSGPWYDRLGRLVATTKDDLLQDRPRGADPAIINDLPNEYGVPNHNPDGTGNVDNHTTLTGTGSGGVLFSMDWGFTCHDWTTKVGTDGTPKIGFSWRGGAGAINGSTWFTGQFNEAGCADYINITDAMGPDQLDKKGVGSQGGYGGFYCLALEH
ncbi:MAG TPA: hypothetical protein VK550_02655 [Polyangiaceae bacterium]|nr:hypothetical protein [Polyangiaceae bacterium]